MASTKRKYGWHARREKMDRKRASVEALISLAVLGCMVKSCVAK